jgi:ADP-ribosylglycohydrolase
LYEGEPVKAIARGAATGGDSDSIAAIAGALAGAAYGMDCWPEPWADQIEYGYDLRRLSALL